VTEGDKTKKLEENELQDTILGGTVSGMSQIKVISEYIFTPDDVNVNFYFGSASSLFLST